ncbi:hypothetical protein [Thiohalocapsa sp. ML1]|jgi:hypothetical protein|uniref:hypothetical protein n=1 Tax=Thiohalocapsa sp. ML1 TaxID=1431688 RepID=UPI000731F6D5|nr:hypothetical protein [Thiohalocapsa sp. ML1]
MTDARLLRRHRAYYPGWAQPFGLWELLRDARVDLRWLLGDGEIGLVLDPSVRTQLRGGDTECLGGLFADAAPPAPSGEPRRLAVAQSRPALIDVGGETLRLGRLTLRQCPAAIMDRVRRLLTPGAEVHLFESFHPFLNPGTRILTLSRRAPLALVYRELGPALIRAAPLATPTAPRRLLEAACA